MREPLTLARPLAARSAPSRPVPTRSTARRPSGLAQIFPDELTRTAALMIGVFVIGAALGWLVTRPFAATPTHPVTLPEYTAVVAQLYQRDNNLGLAKDRMAIYGTPAELALQALRAAQANELKTTADQPAVEGLAKALGAPIPTSASTDARPVDSPDAAPAASASSDDQPSWIGPILAFMIALGLGGIVLLRTAGVSFSGLGLPLTNRAGTGSTGRTATRASAAASRMRVDASRRPATTRAAVAVSEPEEDEGDEEDEEIQPVAAAPPVARPTPRVTVETRRPAAPARAIRIPSYQSCYRLGDDAYDEIHPITDPATGSLIAACGLTSTLKYNTANGAQYYAFTAWLQDYLGTEQLNAAGLVAQGALDSVRDQIQSWVRGGQIDAVVPIEKGMTAEIGSAELSATVTIVDVEYGDDPGARQSYLRKLVVRFDVQTSR